LILYALSLAALIASAGNSSLILLHELDPLYPTSDPLTALTGHYANVCALSYSGKRRKLISASWDCAARIWTRVRGQGPSGKDVAGKWDCEKVLSGHSAAVWGVAIFEEGPREGCYITGWSIPLPLRRWPPLMIVSLVKQALRTGSSNYGRRRVSSSMISLYNQIASVR
jgi:WD40 repeat protein